MEYVPEDHKALSEDLWHAQSTSIRQFLLQRDDFEQLGQEIAHTLGKLTVKAEIKTAHILSRAKTLESFLEKITRKKYDDPFEQVTDFAGVRVVCFYPDDLPKIDKIIDEQFSIISREHTNLESEPDRFGYTAMHFLVRLGDRNTGSRYDDLKGKTCEIQVRTVLQDAWAVFSHHLLYKHESDLPAKIRRDLNALAGALEVADTAFQAIRDSRAAYRREVIQEPRLESVPINLDSLHAYLTKRFPNKQPGGILPYAIEKLQQFKVSNLGELEVILRNTERQTDEFWQWSEREDRQPTGASLVVIALALSVPEYRGEVEEGSAAKLNELAVNVPQFKPATRG